MLDNDGFLRTLSTIAQTLITEYDVSDVLHDLCRDVRNLVDVDGAVVLLATEHGGLRVAAAESRMPGVASWLEHVDEGPAQEAFADGKPVWGADLRTRDDAFAEDAGEHGVVALHAVPMRVHHHLIGALAVWAGEPVKLEEDQREATTTLAACASAYVLNHRAYEEMSELAEQLRTALESRVVIEQAKGVVRAARRERRRGLSAHPPVCP
jgi:transcriptional regulator with GAF, ATPase, and Fis domain